MVESGKVGGRVTRVGLALEGSEVLAVSGVELHRIS